MAENIWYVQNNPKPDRSDHIPNITTKVIHTENISVVPSLHITSPKQKMDKYALIFLFKIIYVLSRLLLIPISWQFLTLITNCGCVTATHSSNARITLVCLWMIDDGALTRYNRTEYIDEDYGGIRSRQRDYITSRNVLDIFNIDKLLTSGFRRL